MAYVYQHQLIHQSVLNKLGNDNRGEPISHGGCQHLSINTSNNFLQNIFNILRFISFGIQVIILKFNGEESEFLDLIGGGPQGMLIGQLEYLVLGNDNADCVQPEDRFKYIDDLTLLQLVCLAGLLTEYSFDDHVASDIGIGQSFLPAASF